MLFSFLCWFVSFVIPGVILGVAMVVSARSSQDREKMSAFECGFDPNRSSRLPFSLRFFLLAVIFLVFDIEITLLLPLPLMAGAGVNYELFMGSSLFVVILVLGLLHEWREGSLDWGE